MARNPIKEAHRYLQKGDYIEAGDLFKEAGEYERAVNMYIKIRAYNKSAPLLEWLGRYKEAARHFAKANEYLKSAELFKQIGENYEAGVMYKKANIPLLAAEMFAKAKAFSEAATMFEEANDFRRAGELYFDRGMFGKSASCFEKVLRSVYFEDKHTENGTPIKKAVGLRCAEAYSKLRKYGHAAELFFKYGEFQKAVQMCREAGDLGQAAKYLEKTGLLEEASKIYSEIGQLEKARHLEIQNLLDKDKFREAATLADDSGDFVIAAEAYERAGDYAKAGEMYRLIGKNNKAAKMFYKGEKYLEAAILFEQVGQIREAAIIREKLGEISKSAELYSLINEFSKSAELFIESERFDDAIRVLQNAWSQGQRTIRIRNLLGLSFMRRGNFDLAYDNYLKFLIEEDVDDQNQEIIYELAIEFEKRGQPERGLKLFQKLSANDLYYKDVKDRIEKLEKTVDLKNTSPNTTLPHQFTPGRMVANRYIIKERVGSGGMGVVYRAQDGELGLEVALKVLKPKYTKDAEMVQRFKQEVTLARRIHHDNVVQLYDFDKVNTLLYISMEFFPSRDLKALVRSKGPLPIEEIIPLMTQVCSGLWAAHQRGIVHRDIKPQNILINDARVVKLVDFGIAIVMDRKVNESSEDFVVGTPEYMSPEQAKGEPTDTRSDIYSLGTILYEAAVGMPPFMNKDSFQVLVDQVESEPSPPIEINRTIPKWMNDLILKCLQKDPNERYDSVQEIERQLATSGIADLMLQLDDDEEYEEDF